MIAPVSALLKWLGLSRRASATRDEKAREESESKSGSGRAEQGGESTMAAEEDERRRRHEAEQEEMSRQLLELNAAVRILKKDAEIMLGAMVGGAGNGNGDGGGQRRRRRRWS